MLVGMPLLRVLDRIGYGGMILATSGQPLEINDTAHLILSEVFGPINPGVEITGVFGRELVKQLLSRGKSRIQLDKENWIVVEKENKRPLIMSALPVGEPGHQTSQEGYHTLLMLIDLDAGLRPNASALEQIFHLSPAEARLAALYAAGASTTEAAAIQGVSVATIRTQTSAIFEKTQTRRQAEIVRLMARLVALP